MPPHSHSSHRRRRRRHHGRRRRSRATRGPALVLLTVVAAGFLLLTVSSLAHGRRSLLLVRANLTAARQALTQRDDVTARAHLDRAAGQLASAGSSASAVPLRVLRPLPILGSPGRALSAAVAAGSEGLAAGRVIAEASSSFPTSASTTVNGHDLRAFHDAATRSEGAVEEARRHLAAASSRLGGPAGAALPQVAKPAKAMRTEIEAGRRQLAGLVRGLALLEDLTGPNSEARLLVLSQDTLELRPTGGYIGSYGILQFSHGTAKLERYQATEDLPDPSPPLAAPDSLTTYLVRSWNLGNANWSPDFPTSATAAAELFRRQGGGDVDGVLALTELATARLVGALGGVQLPSYAKPVQEEGFETRAVFEVEQKRPLDVPRKKFLIELADTLFARIFDLPADKLPAVSDAVKRSVSAGDIQLWFRDPSRQLLLAGGEAAGSLPPPDGDFLMLVDANMTGSKANLETTKQVDYRVERRADGRLVGHVRVELRNEGQASSINPLYNSFLRVYAPPGAELLDRADPQVMTLPVEGPYQVFAQRVFVPPLEQRVVTFDYLLPVSVSKGGTYRLTWLRQVGTARDRLRLAVEGRGAEMDSSRRSLVYGRKLP